MEPIDRLLHVRLVVDRLWREMEVGGVDERVIDRLYLAATKRVHDTDLRREVLVAIAMVAAREQKVLDDFEREGRTLNPKLTADDLLCIHVGVQGRFDAATRDRIRAHPCEIADAVRAWRTKPGRPRAQKLTRNRKAAKAEVITKWDRVAKAVRAALNLRRYTAQSAEQLWKIHGVDFLRKA